MTSHINRRTILTTIPALAGAAALSAPSIARSEAFAGVGAAKGRDLTPLTYCPVSMQRQFGHNKQAIAGKAYEKFFTPNLEVPLEWARLLQHGPMPLEQTLTPSVADINKLLDPSLTFPDAGYRLLDGPAAYAQSRIEMPNVTTEMFKWWFMWHPIEKERYMIWFPHAHIDNFVEDPKRLADTSLSYEQRLYNNPNSVDEFIGPNSLKIIIHFTDPGELGLDAAALKRAGFTASASGTISIAEAPDTTFMLMLHLARDTDRGLELYSRYWIGAHEEFKRFKGGADAPSLMNKMGMNAQALEMLAYEMSVHDMTEFNQLARILPDVYREFGS
ncbi:DAPG hydrolase family protein [Bartonella sp. LJL80]